MRHSTLLYATLTIAIVFCAVSNFLPTTIAAIEMDFQASLLFKTTLLMIISLTMAVPFYVVSCLISSVRDRNQEPKFSRIDNSKIRVA